MCIITDIIITGGCPQMDNYTQLIKQSLYFVYGNGLLCYLFGICTRCIQQSSCPKKSLRIFTAFVITEGCPHMDNCTLFKAINISTSRYGLLHGLTSNSCVRQQLVIQDLLLPFFHLLVIITKSSYLGQERGIETKTNSI